MTDNDTCSVIDCPNEGAYGGTCGDHLYDCHRCGNPQVAEQPFAQMPILCKECGWVRSRGGLQYLFKHSTSFEDWTLDTNREDELVFQAPWLSNEEWRFEACHDPTVDDWQINAYREDGIGFWNPGSADTWGGGRCLPPRHTRRRGG